MKLWTGAPRRDGAWHGWSRQGAGLPVLNGAGCVERSTQPRDPRSFQAQPKPIHMPKRKTVSSSQHPPYNGSRAMRCPQEAHFLLNGSVAACLRSLPRIGRSPDGTVPAAMTHRRTRPIATVVRSKDGLFLPYLTGRGDPISFCAKLIHFSGFLVHYRTLSPNATTDFRRDQRPEVPRKPSLDGFRTAAAA
jgi:hypothetical protein